MIKKIILDSLTEINHELKNKALNSISDNTQIFDNLDSVAVLDLIIEIESRLQLEYGEFIQVADDTVMDEIHTPFKTLSSLIGFVEKKVNT